MERFMPLWGQHLTALTSKFAPVLLLSLATLPLLAQQTTAPELYRDADAYAVYSLVLPQEEGWQGQRLVIRETTGTDPNLLPLQKCIPLPDGSKQELQPLYDNFEQANRQSKTLLPMLTIAKPYDLVPESRVYVADVTGDADKAWEVQHPGAFGYLWVSAVGFNSDRTLALVSVSHVCGNMCAGGHYYLLRKQNGKWQSAEFRGGQC